MKTTAKVFHRRWFWLALVLVSFSISCLFGDPVQSGERIVPRDGYELHFLGCKPDKAPNEKTHTGVFVFIWKGSNPINIKTFPSTDKKTFHPFANFRAHEKSEWISPGGIEDPTEWTIVQPGEVTTFLISMGWIDNPDMSTLFGIKDADKACLVLDSKDGALFSDEFPLPLFPKSN